MDDERDADYAIRGLDRREFGRKGRRLRVEWSKVSSNDRDSRRPSASRRSAVTRPSKTLFVINFDQELTRTKDLERHFDPYGKIISVRIRRNFAFVQYESQEDATRAVEATNMSKLIDRVISVEYAVRDDDERKDGFSPEKRSRDRSLDRGRDRRRSPSPYKSERGSPDYGRGSSPGLYRKDRGSPDYGRRTSPYRKERANPDYAHGRSKARASPEYAHRRSPSSYRRDRSDHGRVSSRSPRKERVSADRGRGRSRSRSPYVERDGTAAVNGHAPSSSPPNRIIASPEICHGPSISHYEGEGADSPEEGRISSPGSVPDAKESPNYGGPESPMHERYSSRSPQAEEE